MKPKHYACRYCGKIHSYKVDHERHVAVHEKAKLNPCIECKESFQHLVELARHITKAHRQIKDGKTECPICKKIVSAIGHHLRTHEHKPITCEKCHAVLNNYSAYKCHLRQHDLLSKMGRDRYVTPKSSIVKSEYDLICPFCNKKYAYKNQLLKHLKFHVEFYSNPCPYCPLDNFQSLADLMKHISNDHRPSTGVPIDCSFCFMAVSNIEQHISLHEPNEYDCEFCSISFPTIFEYKKHLRKRHQIKKPKKTSLQLFMDKYSSPKPNFKQVNCFQCRKKVRISHMKWHLTSHQTYKCIMCQKTFFNLQSLGLHEFNHQLSSQRCPVCSQSFRSHIRLMAHIKMVHKMPFSASKACQRCSI